MFVKDIELKFIFVVAHNTQMAIDLHHSLEEKKLGLIKDFLDNKKKSL